MNKYDIKNLSLEEKVGQLFMIGFDALELNDHVIELIKKYKVGNLILFARNYNDPKQLFILNQNLQKLAIETTNIPMFISIDQEGGMVTRIKNKATFFPGAMTITATDNPNNAYLVGKIMGKELVSLGINMNLAPSLDVNNNPYNPVIGVRSYSDDPNKVSIFGNQFIKGLQENVIATAKHFPGHGDTNVDSHLDLPKINKTMKQIEEFELIPFKSAINNGIKAIMSSHINFPILNQDGLPVTLSKQFLTDYLRNRLNFNGLILTDCMQMKAIQRYYTTKKGSLMAINAGANIIAISHDKHLQIEAIDYIKQSLNDGLITLDTIDERVKRVLEFKENNIVLNLNTTYDDVKSIIEDTSSKEFTLSIVKDAITLVKGEEYRIGQKSLLIASEPLQTTIADEASGDFSIISSVIQNKLNIDTYKISVEPTTEETTEILEKITKYDNVVFCSYNANIYRLQLELIKLIQEKKKLYCIAMRNPYDLTFLPSIENLVLAYEYTPLSIKAVVEYLKGNLSLKGKVPVKL